MADKNNIAAEDYLDSLLRSIMGEEEDTTASNNTNDNIKNEDPFGLDEVIGSKDIEEDFLSDFEKEFFDDEETKLMAELMNEVKQVETEMKPEPAHDSDNNLMSLDDIDLDGFTFDEPKEEIQESISNQQTVADTPQQLDDIAEDVNLLFDGFDDFDINEMNEGAALVDEAVDKGDAKVEDDLKGLYDILGVDSVNEELPETVITSKEKKKGLFAKLFGKKDKKEKSSDKKQKATNNEMQLDENAATLNDFFGDEDIKISSDGLDDNSIDLSSAFDLFNNMQGEASNEADSEASGSDGEELIDFDAAFGLDDSAFDAFDSGTDDESFGQPFSEMEADLLFGDDNNDDDELEDKKGKKGKKDKKYKKDKKDKKGKNVKKDKGKKPKKAKAPKEKKPKEPDEIIEVPLIFIIFLVSFVLVAVLGASMGGDYYNYQQKVYEAVKIYVDTDQTDIDKYEKRYSEAYDLLSGLTMKDEDHKVFFNQVQTVMFMDIHYEAYKNYMLLDDYSHGLDSLIKAVKMYDKHQNAARDLGCFDDMTVILGWVDDKLNNVYGISVSRAREIYMIGNDREYATIVRAIAAEAEAAAINRVEPKTNGNEDTK